MHSFFRYNDAMTAVFRFLTVCIILFTAQCTPFYAALFQPRSDSDDFGLLLYGLLNSSATVLSEAPWWNTDYNYRRRIVFGTDHSALDDGFTASLSFDSTVASTGVALASGDDIRIVWQPVSGAPVELDRLITGPNTTTSEILFRIQTDISQNANEASDGIYYIYYGNAAAASPPETEWNVYYFADFFDRADSNTVEGPWTTEWNNTNTDIRIASNRLVVLGSDGILDTGIAADFSNGAIPGAFEMTFELYRQPFDSDGNHGLILWHIGDSNMAMVTGGSLITGVGPGLYFGRSNEDGGYPNGTTNAGLGNIGMGYTTVGTTPDTKLLDSHASYTVGFRKQPDGQLRYLHADSITAPSIDGPVRSYVDTSVTDLTRIRVGSTDLVSTQPQQIDNLIVRLLVENDPETSVQAEQTQ